MRELAQTQTGDGNEVGYSPESSCSALGSLQQPVHGFDEGVAAVIEHAAHHRVKVSLQGVGQPFEGVESTAPRPRYPGLQLGAGQLGLVVGARAGEDLAQCHLQPPGTRGLEVGPLQPVHGLDLRGRPARRIPAHAPQDGATLLGREVTQLLLHPRLVGLPLGRAHLVHGLAGKFDDMEAVVADQRVGQVGGGAFEIGRTHVHADVGDSRGLTTVGLQVLGKGLDCLMVTPGRAEQQPLGIQIVHHSDVLVPAAQACLVDADDAHPAHVLLLARLAHIVFDAPPQLLVAHTQIPGCLAHGQAPTHPQRQRFKQQREAAALARPRHADLRGLAAGRGPDEGHFGMQPGLVLKKGRVVPLALKPVMHLLRRRAARWAGQQRLLALDIEVDAVLGGVKPHIPNNPWCLKAQRAGEQRLHLNAQFHAPENRPVDMWTGSKAACPHAHRARRRPAILTVSLRTKLRGAKLIRNLQ